MKISLLAIAVTWKCAECDMPITTTTKIDDFGTVDATPHELVNEVKHRLLPALDAYFDRQGYDTTQHAPTCSQFTRLRVPK